MEFTWPVMLWSLLLLPAFIAWYVLGVRRVRRRAAQRFAEAPLFAQIAVRLPHLRRHVSMALYFLALGLLLAASSRPVLALPLPVNRATVILLIDTSGSMAAPDILPSRLEAAKLAARKFLDSLPQGPKVGLVSFSTYATMNVPPTPDHEAVKEALAALKPQEATAIGDGIGKALAAIPGRSLPQDAQPGPFTPFAPAPGTPSPPAAGSPPAPTKPEDLPPAAIILLSDGGQNAGTADPLRMAVAAREQRVKIYTIGLGQPGGGVFMYQGQMVLVPFDPSLLQQVAAVTNGRYFTAPAARDLQQIYRDLGRMIGWERRKTEVSALAVGAAGVLMLGGGLLSLLWMGRLP